MGVAGTSRRSNRQVTGLQRPGGILLVNRIKGQRGGIFCENRRDVPGGFCRNYSGGQDADMCSTYMPKAVD